MRKEWDRFNWNMATYVVLIDKRTCTFYEEGLTSLCRVSGSSTVEKLQCFYDNLVYNEVCARIARDVE
jgi:hypothetical protein